MQRRIHCRSKARGFTLIEIMVVVVIIGLLAAVVAPNFFGQLDTATTNRVMLDIRNIESALGFYRGATGQFPTTTEGLEALVTNPGGQVAERWRQQMPRIPTDPWDVPYQYRSPGQQSGGDFDVYTLGRDGQEGGDGQDADIGNWNID